MTYFLNDCLFLHLINNCKKSKKSEFNKKVENLSEKRKCEAISNLAKDVINWGPQLTLC